MNPNKVQQAGEKDNTKCPSDKEGIEGYDNYVAVDWSEKTMAIARMTKLTTEPTVFERTSDLKELKLYLHQLKGRTILTIEETTTSHWLYVELKGCVERILICDPYRNHLLSEGPQTDKSDASKLCLLLKAKMLKEVFHSTDKLYELRRLVSAYQNVVKQGVRVLNQRSALTRARVPEATLKTVLQLYHTYLGSSEELYRQTKAAFEKKFIALGKRIPLMKAQMSIPGIGEIGAAKIVAYAVDGRRFVRSGKYLSYCGLVKWELASGGKVYGRKNTRCNQDLKAVYKTATMAALQGTNTMQELYDHLRKKGIAEHNARNAVTRYIARVSLGMLKNGQSFEPYRWRKAQLETTRTS